MTFIPNSPSASFADQAEPDSVDFDILLAGIRGDGVISGCAVTAQGSPDMTVAVASGSIQIASTTIAVTGANVTITAAHSTNARFDLVVVNNAGTLSATAGTATSNPVFPAIPANSIVLAAVYVPANDTAINSTQIIDKRTLVLEASTAITVYRCRLKLASDTAGLTTTTDNYISWTAEDYDTNTFHDNVTNPTRMTFASSGVYIVTFHGFFNGNAAMTTLLRINGTTVIRKAAQSNQNPNSITITTQFTAATNDYLEAAANPGATAGVTVEADWSYFECHKIAS